MAGRLHEAITAPMDILGSTVRVGASIGVAMAGEPGVKPEELLEVADRQLYELKRSGKNGWRSFVVA